MKKLIVLAIIMAVMVLVAALAHAQAPANDLKPTFISPTPGLYVNGWPAFTVSYPKEWTPQDLQRPTEVYRAAWPGFPPLPAFVIYSFANPADISGSAKWFAGLLGIKGDQQVKVLSDKPSQLQDGTPAQEAEFDFFYPNGPKLNEFMLATKKDDIWIMLTVVDQKGMIGDDLKSIAYSLKVAQGKQEPVKLPPDLQAFVEKWCSDVNSGDAGRIMTNYSDHYLDYGMNKADMEKWYRNDPSSPIQLGITSATLTVTIFEPRGDKAYLAGFHGGKLKSGAPGPTPPLTNNQLIKENGEWKWYGNQRKVVSWP